MIKKFHIGIAVYNEAKNIKKSLLYLEDSLKNLYPKYKFDLIICPNGCTDNSEEILEDIKKEFKFPIKLVSSEKGKLFAHKKILESIRDKSPIIFMDADILVPSKTINNLLEYLDKNHKIEIISSYPYVIKPKKLTFYQRIIYPILNLKRIFPMIEISKYDVNEFHKDALNEFERKSRIYFHGRCFIIKNKEIYKFPEKGSKIRGDDTFLSLKILHTKPKGSIKISFNSPVYSIPLLSIRKYLNTWYRIRKDLDYIYKEYPEFLSLRKKTTMKLNWNYIFFSLPFKYKLSALGFCLLRLYEKTSYHIIKPWIHLDYIWRYDEKESLEGRKDGNYDS